MCYEVVSKKSFMLNYYLKKCKTPKMCEKTVDACLPVFKFVPD